MKLLLLAAALALPLTLPAQEPHHDAAGQDMHHDKPPVPPSHSLKVTFQGHDTTFSVEDLLKLPQVTLHVHNAHANGDETYTGPLLSDVLAKAGLSPAHENEALILHSSIVATATDGYFVLYSAAEVEPAFTTGRVILALMKSGLPNAANGNIQLVNEAGAKPARWVHGLSSLNIMTLAPAR